VHYSTEQSGLILGSVAQCAHELFMLPGVPTAALPRSRQRAEQTPPDSLCCRASLASRQKINPLLGVGRKGLSSLGNVEQGFSVWLFSSVTTGSK